MSLEAMKMALEFVEWLCSDDHSVKPKNSALKTREALRQAIEAAEKQETLILDRGCWERGCVAYDERDGDGVNISQERVDETVKRKHEPVAWMYNGTIHEFDPSDWATIAKVTPLYTAPPKREWVGLTEEEMTSLRQKSVMDGMRRIVSDFEYIRAIEAKLKEKNRG